MTLALSQGYWSQWRAGTMESYMLHTFNELNKLLRLLFRSEIQVCRDKVFFCLFLCFIPTYMFLYFVFINCDVFVNVS